MSNEEMNPVEFGKLISSVDHLTGAVTTLTEKVAEMEARLNTGQGFAIGLVIAAAGIGGSIGAFAHKILEVIR